MEEDGLFIAESVPVIRRLLASNYQVSSVLVTPRRLGELEPDLHGVDAQVYVTSQPVMNRIVGFDIHRGALAAALRGPARTLESVVHGATRLAVLEDLNDLENVGVVFRAGAALGIDAVVLSPRCCDPLYRRVVRVSMGYVLHVPFAFAREWPDALDRLRADGFRVAALTPDPGATPLGDVHLRRDERVAVLLGAEGPGLSGAARERADLQVRIPMRAAVDSLNVASAAAIAFHHLGAAAARS